MAETRRHKLKGEHIYEGMVMSAAFPAHILDRVKTFKLYDGDVIITTYPKAGVTWYQEVLWLVMNNADVKTASEVYQDNRIPFLEINKGKAQLDIDILEAASPPRIIKTHLPYRFFENELKEKKVKVVLGARNIKDTLVSMYHFYRMNAAFGNMTGPFSEFFDLFKEKHLAYGDWFEFNLGWWNQRENIELFVLKYEDLHKDMLGTLRRLADFLGAELTDEQLNAIAVHVSFDQMRGNDKVNKTNYIGMFDHSISPFMRKGKVGDWQNHLTGEQNAYVDKMYEEKMKGSGLDFDFTI